MRFYLIEWYEPQAEPDTARLVGAVVERVRSAGGVRLVHHLVLDDDVVQILIEADSLDRAREVADCLGLPTYRLTAAKS